MPRWEPEQFLADLDRLASAELWPGFIARQVPVAIFDGEHTFLYRHPASIPGFRALSNDDSDPIRVYLGRHPTVRANTSTVLAGTATATVIVSPDHASAEEIAALAIHEAFHVYQQEHHPDWGGNEMDLFAYPMDDVTQLLLSRLESTALRRAVLSATQSGQANIAEIASSATTAMNLRHQRFGALPQESVNYERGTELKEGLARYVESKARGSHGCCKIPMLGFAPEAIRLRCYSSGHALAVLLDRLYPSWTERLAHRDCAGLDVWLQSALDHYDTHPHPFKSDAQETVLKQAERDITELRRERVKRRETFVSQPGWSLTIEAAADSPLFLDSFDPMNIDYLGNGQLLHTGQLMLANTTTAFDIIDRSTLTVASAHNPLDGIARAIVTGLQAEPAVTTSGEETEVTAPGLEVRSRGGRISRTNHHVVLTLTRS